MNYWFIAILLLVLLHLCTLTCPLPDLSNNARERVGAWYVKSHACVCHHKRMHLNTINKRKWAEIYHTAM